MLASLQDFIASAQLTTCELPLFGCPIPAGFPSPADDHLDAPLDLTRHLFRHPAATFLARVSGDSMSGAGIHPGDLVAVDRALRPVHGSIVVAVVEGGQPWLGAKNARYPSLAVDREAGLMV